MKSHVPAFERHFYGFAPESSLPERRAQLTELSSVGSKECLLYDILSGISTSA
jgi:hypothetical protein